VTADVLLSGLEGEDVTPLAADIDRFPDDPARHPADLLLPGGQKAEVGAAELERNAQRLALSHAEVGPHLPGRLEQRQSEGVGHHNEQRPGLVR